MITTNHQDVKYSKKFSNNLLDNKNKIEVKKNSPCRHCGSPDHCYRLPNSPFLEVCKKDGEPCEGWKKTSKHDSEGSFYLAPIAQQKEPRPKQRREWRYDDRQGNPLVRVVRQDDGTGEKRIWQQHYRDGQWVAGLEAVKREDIPLYRWEQIPKARALNAPIFIVEGEPCADAMIHLGFFATTNIGGSGKFTDSDQRM